MFGLFLQAAENKKNKLFVKTVRFDKRLRNGFRKHKKDYFHALYQMGTVSQIIQDSGAEVG